MMLSYIGKKLFCRKTAKFYAKITRNGKIFVVSIFPVMVSFHPINSTNQQFPLIYIMVEGATPLESGKTPAVIGRFNILG